MTPSFPRSIPTLLLVLGGARVGLLLLLGFRPFDDTFITFRYALNLASGHGLVYNIGEPILGITTPLWGALLSLAPLFGLRDMGSVALVLGGLLDLISALLICHLVWTWSGDRWLAAAAGLLLLTHADYSSIVRSGMEISLFSFLALACITALASGRHSLGTGFACMSYFARPEGILLVPLALACAALAHSRRRRRVLQAIGLVLLFFVPWVTFTTIWYGSPVAQSVVAKRGMAELDPGLKAFSRMNLRLLAYEGQYGGGRFERTWLQGNLAWLAFLTLAALQLASRLRRELAAGPASPKAVAWLSLLALLAAWLAAHGFLGGFSWFPWYYGPVYVLAIPLVALGAHGLFARSSSAALRGRGAVATISLLAALQVYTLAAIKLPKDVDAWPWPYQQVLAPDLPLEPNVVIGATEIGMIGWAAWPTRVFDAVGLVNHTIASASLAERLRNERPDYLCFRSDEAAQVLEQLDSDHWLSSVYELKRTITQQNANREYLLYRKRRPNGQAVGGS